MTPTPATSAASKGDTVGHALLAIPLALAFVWALGKQPVPELLTVAGVVASVVLVATDSSGLGMGTVRGRGGEIGTRPVIWMLLTLILSAVAVPAYLYERSKWGRQNMGPWGAITMAAAFASWAVSAILPP